MADLFELASDAVFSPCGKYRYLLRRQLKHESGKVCLFIMLNPSTADATADDPTIRKCIKLARSWGFRWLHVVNLFAWRATSPDDMKAAADPVGNYNFQTICDQVADADLVVCAWGNHGSHCGQGETVKKLFFDAPAHYLALNKDGSPKHPLYCRDDTQPMPWNLA